MKMECDIFLKDKISSDEFSFNVSVKEFYRLLFEVSSLNTGLICAVRTIQLPRQPPAHLVSANVNQIYS